MSCELTTVNGRQLNEPKENGEFVDCKILSLLWFCMNEGVGTSDEMVRGVSQVPPI